MTISVIKSPRHGGTEHSVKVHETIQSIKVSQILKAVKVSLKSIVQITCYNVSYGSGIDGNHEIVQLDSEIIPIKDYPYIFITRGVNPVTGKPLRFTFRLGYLYVD